MSDIETRIRQWRDQVRGTGAVSTEDLEELESHLRDTVDDLSSKGLDGEESFLIAVKRLGSVSAVGAEYSKSSTENLWRQLVLEPSAGDRSRYVREVVLVVVLALLAGFLGRIPAVFGVGGSLTESIVSLKNLSLFAFPPVAAYLIWKRGLGLKHIMPIGLFAVAAAVAVNLYPSLEPNHTANLIAFNLPIALWLLIGLAYAGSGWRRSGVRMDFVRFSGEAFIYGVLVFLGIVVFVFATQGLFELAGVQTDRLLNEFVFPFGVLAVPVVAVFLVERKKTVIENIAPVLARIFTPLFLILVVSVLVTIAWTGGLREDRNLLIMIDAILALILGLVLYTMSAREVGAPFGLSDWLILALVIAAVALDIVALSAIILRLADFGLSPNRLMAAGINVLLLVNLAGLAVAYLLFRVRKTDFESIVDVQMKYLPAYLGWSTVVVFAFPPFFGWV